MRASFVRKEGEQFGPEIPKIKCAFHSDQLLTNFCACKSCLLPLCPSCIKIHVNQHISMKTNPHLQNINQILRSIYSQLETYGDKFNTLHKQFVQIQTQVQQFREKLRNKIYSAKNELISAIQEHFKRMEIQTLQKINDLKYVKNLVKYKEYTKKAILSLKNTERIFFTDQSKVMRMIIKYQSNSVEKQLQNFYFDSDNFIKLHSEHFFTFSVRDNFAQLAIAPIHNLLKIDLKQSCYSPEPHDITQNLKELYEKQPQKKELKKSLYKFLTNKNTPSKNNTSSNEIYDSSSSSNIAINSDPLSDFAELISNKPQLSVSSIRPELAQINQNIDENEQMKFVRPVSQKGFSQLYAYQSVKDSIFKATKDLNYKLNRPKVATEGENHRRRSLSKGKGITLMQSNTTVIDFKKNTHNSILKCDMDLNFMSGKTQSILRKCR